jgi:hypothetical protein
MQVSNGYGCRLYGGRADANRISAVFPYSLSDTPYAGVGGLADLGGYACPFPVKLGSLGSSLYVK